MKRYDAYNRLLEGETIGWVGSKRIVRQPTIDEFALLLSLLKHEKSRLRWRSADRLGKLGTKKAIEPLVEALQDSQWLVRLHATKALGRIDASVAVEYLISMAKDECPSVRRSALVALQQSQFIENPQITEVFLSALTDSNATVRSIAVISLGYTASPSIVVAIANIVEDPDNNVSWRAIDALQRVGQPAVDVLIQLLKSPNDEVRYRTVKTLGRIGGTRSLNAIKNMLNDSSEKVRRRSEWEIKLKEPGSILQGKYSEALEWIRSLLSIR